MLEKLRQWVGGAAREDRELAALRSEVMQLAASNQAMSVQLAAARRADLGSGVSINYGQFRYDPNDTLHGAEKWVIFEKMLTDPRVKAAIRANTLPLLNAKWKVVPASDSPRDQEIADFVAANLYRQTNDNFGREYWCQSSWKAQRLPEILRMLEHGYAMFAKQTRMVRGKRVFDRIAWLEPDSVDPRGWNLSETDEILSVKRTFSTPAGEYKLAEALDAEQLALYVWDLAGARFAGRPMTRAMYGSWYRKEFMQRMLAVWAQKVGAPAPIGIAPSGYAPEDFAALERFVKQMRGTAPADSYGVFTRGADGSAPEFKFAGAEARGIGDFAASIDKENLDIFHAGGIKSQALGETQSGARAVGDIQQKLEMIGIRSIAEVIVEWETHGVGNLYGLVEELVEWNYGGADLPQIQVEGIDPDENARMLEQLILLVDKKAIPVEDPRIRKRMALLAGIDDMPDDVFEFEAPQPVIAPPGQPAPQPDAPETPDPEEPPPDEASASLEYADLLRPMEGAPTGGTFRRPNRLESEFCDLAAIGDAFRVGEREAATALGRAHRAMGDELLARIAGGKISVRNLGGQRRSRFRGGARQRQILRDTLDRIGQQGAEHVSREIQRLVGASLIAEDLRFGGKRPPAELLALFVEEMGVVAEFSVDKLWARLLDLFLTEYLRLTREGFAGRALYQRLETFLDSLSAKPVEDLARQVSSVAYNEGRDVGLRTGKAATVVERAVRSELLDSKTCEVCVHLDGKIVEIGTPEYEEFQPPSKCLGGDRCRGFYVALPRSGA